MMPPLPSGFPERRSGRGAGGAGSAANQPTRGLAQETVARSYLAAQNIDEARQAIEQAAAAPTPPVDTRFQIAVTAARVQESKSRSDAIRQLQSAIPEITRHGYQRTALLARLALAEMEGRAGQTATART